MKSTAFILPLIVWATYAFAQQPPPSSFEVIDGVTFQKPFKAKLIESRKLSSRPTLPDATTQGVQVQPYSVPGHNANLEYPAPTIRPVAMPKLKKEEPYKFYGKLGFGWPLSPLAELSYHNGSSEKMSYGGTFKHHSAFAGDDGGNRNFMRYKGDGHFTYYLPNKLALGMKADYDNHTVHYYGYDLDSFFFRADEVKQRFQKIGLDLLTFNSNASSIGLRYGGNISGYYLNDSYNAKEWSAGGKAYAEKRIADKFPLYAEIGAQHVSYTDTLPTQNRWLPYLKTNITWNSGIFSAKLGAWLGTNRNKFQIFPDVELNAKVWQEKMSVFAGWNGEVRWNTFNTMRQYNPFINTQGVTYKNSSVQSIYGGLKGDINKIAYEIRYAYRPSADLPMFVNSDRWKTTKFDVAYDSATIQTVSGSLKTELFQHLSIRMEASYHFYSFTRFTASLGLPNLEGNLEATYKMLDDKLHLKGTFHTMAGINYVDGLENGVLPGLYDLSVGARYQFSKNFSGFVDANNLLLNQNQRWYQYRQFGINFMAGVIFRFQ